MESYLSPDALYNTGITATFVYNNEVGLVSRSGRHITHEDLIVSAQYIKNELSDWLKAGTIERVRGSYSRMRLEDVLLFGRAGEYEGRFIISFWNEDLAWRASETHVYDMLGDCLKAMDDKGMIPDRYVEIHTPHGVSDYWDEDTRKPSGTKLSPEQRRKLDLQKRLHLMRGQEKREAMKELGLWTDEPAKHPWQSGLEKVGELGPGQKWWAPHSESIDPRGIALLISEDIKGSDTLIIPDDLLTHKAVTILYTRDHRLYTARGDTIHRVLEREIMKEDEEFRRYHAAAERNVQMNARSYLQKYAALYGRAGPIQCSWDGSCVRWQGRSVPERLDKFVVSFWNDDQGIYDKLLGSCLKALESKGILPDSQLIEIHTPLDISDYQVGLGETDRQRETTPEQQERYKLQRRLHLATGEEKREIMKKLGLWNDRAAKHAWQSELEKVGELGPGQKWWAPHSEQIERMAQSIDEDI